MSARSAAGNEMTRAFTFVLWWSFTLTCWPSPLAMNATSASSGRSLGKALANPQRVAAVRADGLIGSAQEEAFDRHARLARRLLKAHAGYVTFVDDAYVFFKSTTGDDDGGEKIGRIEAARSFCGHVVDTQEVMLIGDARLDARFSNYRRVRDGQIVSYAGAPVLVDGLALGTLCVSDRQPRQWSEDEVRILRALADAVATEVELYRRTAKLKRTEARLRRREAELSLCLDAAGIGTFVERFDSGRSSADARTLAFFGYQPEEWDGTLTAILARIVAEDRAQVVAAIERAGERDEPYRCEFRVQRPDGSQRWLAARGRVERDAGSAYLLGVNFDITDRKQGEAELVESRARLRESLERLALAQRSIGAGVWDWQRGAGDAAYVTPECRALYGLSEDVPVTLHNWLRCVHPDDRARSQAEHHAFMRGHDTSHRSEYRIVHPHEGVRWLERVGYVQRDASGRPLRFTGINLDITRRKEVEFALRQSEERLRLALDAACAGSWELLPATGEMVASERAMQMFGFAPGTRLTLQRALEAVHPEDRQPTRAALQDTIASGRPFKIEFRVLAPAGQPRWLGAHAELQVRDMHTRLVGLLQDVTERRQAQEALELRSRQLALAMQASLAVVFEWDIVNDRVWRSMSANVAMPLTAPTRPDRFEDVVGRVHPDDRDLFRRSVEAALRDEGGAYAGEFRVLDPAGRTLWMSEQGQVQRDARGVPVRLLGVSHDVTRYREAAASLEASEAFTRQVTDVAPAVLYIYDLVERRNVWGNREMTVVLGYTRAQIDDMAGRLLQQLMHPQDWPRYLAYARTLMELQDGEVAEFDYRMRRADGAWCWLHSRDMVFQRGEDGRPRRIVGAALDVSARREAEDDLARLAQALQQEHRRKDEFLAMLAHELRNPLAPLRNAVHLLKGAGPLGQALERTRDIVERQVGHLTRLVDDLLDVSRVSQGKIRLEMEPLDLAVAIRQAIELAQPLVEAKRQQLRLSLPPEATLCVRGDLTRLTQVVSNLLNNAAKYTDDAGRIDVSAGVEGAEVVLRVADTGCGIAPDLLPHVFELFTQADRSLERSQGGLGIGLALVRSLVERHGGKVHVASEPGSGSTFTVRLPVSEIPCALAGEVADAGAAVSRRVLVVDDNADAAETLCTLLALDGHQARCTFTPEAALELAAEFVPEVCILDIGLPGMSGLELARRLRASPTGCRARYIALSGYGQPEDRTRSVEAGFSTHLTKPVDPAVLSALLRELHPHG